jgi:selenide,water dikinase
MLGSDLYEAMVRSTTQLNRFGIMAAGAAGVHAMTDCTGFGLLGHALEMCEGAGLGLTLEREAVPLLPGVRALAEAEAGIVTGASGRNWDSYGAAIRGANALDRVLLTDPQTSGGLLIAVAPEREQALLASARGDGLPAATLIGRFGEGVGLEVVQ